MEEDIAERLREENSEQFFILVRMHLSFLIDMNTEEVDSPTDKPKTFKWGFSKKSKNGESGGPKTAPGLVELTEESSSQMYQLIDILEQDTNVCQEGIFRRTGALSRQQQLRKLLVAGGSLDAETAAAFSAHDMASVLKGMLADTPEPLLLHQHYQAYCHLASTCFSDGQATEASESRLLGALQLLLLLLPAAARRLAKRLLALLHRVAEHEHANRMAPPALATMFAPHVMCPRKLSPEALHADSQNLAPVLSFMIRRSPSLFCTPPQLATDIAAYLARKQHRRLLSPTGEDLNESVSERTAASTVFTFVDRQMSGVAAGEGPGRTAAASATDAALAQLYAHIQALPESHNKRRLIKQFNRENGHGTPLQLQRANKQRSLGESLKKHIFNKSLMNRSVKKPVSSQDNRFGYQPMVESPSITRHIAKGGSINLNTYNTPKKVSEQESIMPCEKNGISEISESLPDIKLESNAAKDVESKNNQLETVASLSDSNDELDETSLSCDEGPTLERVERLSPKYTSEPNLSFLPSTHEMTPKFSKNRNSKIYKSKTLLPAHLKLKELHKHNIGTLQKQDGTTENEQSKEKSDHSLNIYKSCIKCASDSCSEVEASIDYKDSNEVSGCALMSPDNVTPRLIKKDSVKYLRSKRISLAENSSPKKILTNGHSANGDSVISSEFCDSRDNCTPKIGMLPSKMCYLTSTPAISNILNADRNNYEGCTTPMYPAGHILRRGSMSPITKSTQKMSKAMQESIMTPRSRKPVIINCEPSVASMAGHDQHQSTTSSDSGASDNVYDSSHSMKNDSDFVSTDESCPSTSCRIRYRHIDETNANNSSKDNNFESISESVLSERRMRVLRERDTCLKKYACRAYGPNNSEMSHGNLLQDYQSSSDTSQGGSLTDPFRQYLLCRSVLTGSPVDLSFASDSQDFCDAADIQDISENKMTDSLLFCLDGNRPADVTVNSQSDQSQEPLLKDSSRNDTLRNDNLEGLTAKNSKRLQSNTSDTLDNNCDKVPFDKENISPRIKRSAQKMSCSTGSDEVKSKKVNNTITDSNMLDCRDDKNVCQGNNGNRPLIAEHNYWDFNRCGDLWETDL